MFSFLLLWARLQVLVNACSLILRLSLSRRIGKTEKKNLGEEILDEIDRRRVNIECPVT